MRQVVFGILCWLCMTNSFAQKLAVESFGVTLGDLSASPHAETALVLRFLWQ